MTIKSIFYRIVGWVYVLDSIYFFSIAIITTGLVSFSLLVFIFQLTISIMMIFHSQKSKYFNQLEYLITVFGFLKIYTGLMFVINNGLSAFLANIKYMIVQRSYWEFLFFAYTWILPFIFLYILMTKIYQDFLKPKFSSTTL